MTKKIDPKVPPGIFSIKSLIISLPSSPINTRENILAPIKFILKIKKKEEDLLKIYEEMVQEIGKFDISHRIEFLEKKLIDDMNNETFQELLDLKNQVNQV